MKKLLLVNILSLFIIHSNASWTTNGPPGTNNENITCLAVSGSTIFAGTEIGVFISTNDGGSWTAVNSGLTSTDVLALTINNGNIFAGTNGGVFVSTNNGTSWTAVNSGLQSTTMIVYSLANSGSYVYAGIEGDGVYVSTNNGASWASANTGLGTIYPTSLLATGDTVYAASQYGGVFISSNYAASWTSAADVGLGSAEIFALAVAGSTIYVGTVYDGLFRSSDNGATWTAINNGVSYSNIYALLVVNGSYLFAGSELGGVYESSNNGNNWTSIGAGLPGNQEITALNAVGTTIFAATSGRGVWEDTISGLSGCNITAPVLTAGPNAFCTGDSLQICVTTSYNSYKWNTNPTTQCIEAKQAGSYYVTVTDNNSCTAVSNTVTLSLYPVPADSIVAAHDIFCTGDSTSICALSGFSTYQWNAAGVGNGHCISAKQAGSYSVTVTDNNGCTAASKSITLSIAPVPVDSIVTDKTIFCDQDTAIVCALPGFASYQWNVPDAGTGNCIPALAAGNYYVTVTDNNGCTAESNHLALSVYPPFNVYISEHNDTLLSFGAASYQWILNNAIIPGATDSVYVATRQGTYFLAVTNYNGCLATSSPIVITGFPSITPGEFLKIYPNPAADNFILETSGAGPQLLQVFDLSGQLLLTKAIQAGKTNMEAGTLAAGIYTLRLQSAEGTAAEKLIIVK